MTTNINTQLPKKRIEYIDALRGLTMILVVFGHIEMTCFGFNNPAFTNTGSFIISFHLPLFFWISGFIAYRTNTKWDLHTFLTASYKKAITLLIPAFFIGIIYTYTYLNKDFYGFLTHNAKHGYWFTIALFEIFLILYAVNTFLYNRDPQIHKRRISIALIILSGCLFLAKIALKINPTLNEIANILSFHHSFNYFQYFAFGYICSMYKDEFNKALESKYLAAIIITLFAALFYIKRYYFTNLISDGIDIWRMFDIFLEMIIGYLGLLMAYNTFKTYQNSFTSEKKTGRVLQLIGKRTLDIYILHYFFLPNIPQVGKMLLGGNKVILELGIGLTISFLVIGLCLIISSILRTSPFLAKWLFGVYK